MQSKLVRKINCYVVLGVCVIGLGGTIFTIVNQSNAYESYTSYKNWMWTDAMRAERDARVAASGKSVAAVNAEFEQTETTKYGLYQDRFRTMVIVSAITGGLWIANVVDAALVGKQNRRKIDLYFGGIPGIAAEAGVAYRF